MRLTRASYFLGTIRGDFALAVGRNICHGSDSVESAEKEIALYVNLLSISDLVLTYRMMQLVP